MKQDWLTVSIHNSSASVESGEVLLENSEAALHQHLPVIFEGGKLHLLTSTTPKSFKTVQADPDLSARLIKSANNLLHGI